MVGILEASQNWIHLRCLLLDNWTIFLNRVCGSYKRNEHDILWHFLPDKLHSKGPWLILGDFNQILYHNEKVNASSCSRGNIYFRMVIYTLQLVDIPSSRNFYKWTNNRHGDKIIWEKMEHSI